MKVEIRKITPELARFYMENKVRNRKITKRRVEQLAKAMKDGTFNESGETIKFDKHGMLIDGQHRLKAIIMSNKTINFAVAYDLEPKVFTELDTGKKRSLGDVLFIENFASNTNLAAATTGVYSFIHYGIDKMFHGKRYSATNSRGIQNREFLEFLNKHPMIQQSLLTVSSCGHQKLVTTSFLAVVHYIFARRNKNSADEFAYYFVTGENLSANHPILKLREKLIQNKVNQVHPDYHDLMKMFVVSWNKWRGDKKMKYLRIDTNKPMPRII